MKVKVILHMKDRMGFPIDISYDADLKASILQTEDGLLDIGTVMGMTIDCMPEIRKEK